MEDLWNFPGSSVVKNPPANAGAVGSIPESGRPPGEGNGNSLQYPSLGNSMDRGAWQATVHGVKKELDLVTEQQQKTFDVSTSNHCEWNFSFFRAAKSIQSCPTLQLYGL